MKPKPPSSIESGARTRQPSRAPQDATAPAASPESPLTIARQKRLVRFSTLMVVVVGACVYGNGIRGAFLFDDLKYITENPTVHSLRSFSHILTHSSRPVVELSLAVNYAVSRKLPWSYHVVNIAVHLLAALALFGIVRRTLALELFRDRFRHSATWFALSTALIWVVHPLHTQSVTYVIQRAESLMGLWYLLTLYAFIRGATGPPSRRWYQLSIVACGLGMATKPIMATAPLMILIYDRLFLTGSLRESLRLRKWLYAGLASTWSILAWVLIVGREDYVASAGFAFKGPSPLSYLLTQPGVILHYLRLAAWPHPLLLDYGWPIATTAGEIVPQTLLIGGLIVASVRLACRRSPVGFLGIWFFLILMPSSSIIPVNDLAFEYRMYLSLASVVVGVVFGADWLLRLLIRSASRDRWVVSGGLVGMCVIALGSATILRNVDYWDPVVIWEKAAVHSPSSARIHANLGACYLDAGKVAEGRASCLTSIRLKQDFPEAYGNLAILFLREGNTEEAIRYFRRALTIEPKYLKARAGLVEALLQTDQMPEAVNQSTELLRLYPGYAGAHRMAGEVMLTQGRANEAIRYFTQALELDPDDVRSRLKLGETLIDQKRYAAGVEHLLSAYRSYPSDWEVRRELLGILKKMNERHIEIPAALERVRAPIKDVNVLFDMALSATHAGKLEEAVEFYTQVLQLSPDDYEAHTNLGSLLERLGRIEKAEECYRKAVQIQPQSALAHYNLGYLLAARGQMDDAMRHYQEALQADPKHFKAQISLGLILAQKGRFDEARVHFINAVQIDPLSIEARHNLGNTYAAQNRFEEAIPHYEEALRLDPGNTDARRTLQQIRELLKQPPALQQVQPRP